MVVVVVAAEGGGGGRAAGVSCQAPGVGRRGRCKGRAGGQAKAQLRGAPIACIHCL